ncbi:MAG: hypothetical protein JNK31_08695 [Candidatus Competibacter sp.]|nr:hypothetical protein [Candidatus Competibacter sp.]
MTAKQRLIAILLSGLIPALFLSAEAAPPPGRLLASQCAQCHGTNGRAVGDMDSLSGESAQEIYEELLEMKNSTDLNDIMHRQAKGYSDAQIRLIADYYGSMSGGSGGGDGHHDEHDDD